MLLATEGYVLNFVNLLELELEHELESVFYNKTNANTTQCDKIVYNTMFYVRNPYKGAERTAGV